MSEEKKQELKEDHKQRYQETKKSKNNDLCKILQPKRLFKGSICKKRIHGNDRILRIIIMQIRVT